MGGEWHTATVSELQREGVLLVEDGNHGEYRPRPDEFVAEGVAFIRAADMDGGRVLFNSSAKINKHARQRITKGIGAPGDVLLSHKGTVGKVALVPSDAPAFVCSPQTTFWRSRDPLRLDRTFLYAFLRSPAFHAQLATRAGETDMAPYVSLTSQRGLSVTLPPLPEQRAIAHILGTLDDKIELNRRMNETLEAMARAHFKSWFVDFDPVRAKAEGRDPGLPEQITNLFPDRLVDSELGEIPEGWDVKRVGDIGTIVCGKTPPTQVSEYYGHNVPFVTIPDMHGKIFATLVKKRLSYAGAQSQEKKMLPVGTICVSCIATAGLVVITSELSQTNQQINSVLPYQRDATYFWYWTLRNLGDDIRAGGSGGSVLANLSTGRFSELRLLACVAGLRSCYHSLTAPLLDRILENERESNTLAALRDTLLPKLISGELRVSDATKIIAEATP